MVPVKERSSAMVIHHAGTAVGSVAAPPMIALHHLPCKWRWILFGHGMLGVLWAITGATFISCTEQVRPRQAALVPPDPIFQYSTVHHSSLSLARSASVPSKPGARWAKFLSERHGIWYLLACQISYDERGIGYQSRRRSRLDSLRGRGADGCLCGGGRQLSAWDSVKRARKVALGAQRPSCPLYFSSRRLARLGDRCRQHAYFGQQ